MNEHASSEQILRTEVAGLDVDDILALCYAFQHRTERLALYLDVLRRRVGERAQFASTLVCFDLARHGNSSFQREFVYLSDTMRQLAGDGELAAALIAGDPYLSFVWELCQASLDELDPRFWHDAGHSMEWDARQLATLELLDEADFEDIAFQFEVDEVELWERFDEAVEQFLGSVMGVPVYNPTAGFRLRDRVDVERVEAFLQELDSLREVVPLARGYRALALLFYGAHMRSRSLFAAANQRKQSLLREGLREFLRSGPMVWQVASVCGALHADPEVWPRIAELLGDFSAWLMQQQPAHAAQHSPVDAYDPIARLSALMRAQGFRRQSRRS